jgi:colanic acid/amylovoran biosynthesis protein
MDPTKILLINVHSFQNAGDHALTQVALKQLHGNFPRSAISISITDLGSFTGPDRAVLSFAGWIKGDSNNPRYRFLYLLVATLGFILGFRIFRIPLMFIIPPSLRETYQALTEADLVVCPPGGYFYSDGRGRNLILSLSMGITAICLGKPLYLLPQSIGPFFHGWERAITYWLLNRARLIMVREELSLQHLQELNIPPERAALFPDMAFAYQEGSAQQAREFLRGLWSEPNKGRFLIGITAMDWGRQYQEFHGQARYETAITDLISHILKHYPSKIILLTQCWGPSESENDSLVAQRIWGKLDNQNKPLVALAPRLETSNLRSVIGQLDILIGTRMHSNIFAISQGVPVIPIGYLHKTLGIAKTVGLEEWVIDITKINGESLIQNFERLVLKKNHVQAQIEAKLPVILDKITQAVRLVASDFNKG